MRKQRCHDGMCGALDCPRCRPDIQRHPGEPRDPRPETYTLEEVEELVRAVWAAAKTSAGAVEVEPDPERPHTAEEWIADWRSGMVWGGE